MKRKAPRMVCGQACKIASGPLHARLINYELADGRTKVYTSITRSPDALIQGRLETPDGVNILLFDKEGERILLEKEFRMGVNAYVYNLPQGLVDEGETPVQAAQRELLEECGVTKLDFLATYPLLPVAYTAPGMTNQTEQLLIGRVLEVHPEAAIQSPNEVIEQVWVDREEAMAILEQTEIRLTAKTQALLYGWVWGADFLHSF